MSSKGIKSVHSALSNFNRAPVEQVMENLLQALRVLDLVPSGATELTPHPLIIVRAEIENARRYLSQIKIVEDDRGYSKTSHHMLEVA